MQRADPGYANAFSLNGFRLTSRQQSLEKMNLAKARKSASDRSAPVASFMVADSGTFKPMPPLDGGRREEPEKPQVSPARFFGSFLCEAQRNEHKNPEPARVVRGCLSVS